MAAEQRGPAHDKAVKTLTFISRRWSRFMAVALASVMCVQQAIAASGNSPQSPNEGRESLLAIKDVLKAGKDVQSAFDSFGKFAITYGQGDNSHANDFYSTLKNNDAAQFLSMVAKGAKAFEIANKLKKDGVIAGGYSVGRDYAIKKAAEILGTIAKQATLAIFAGGAAPSFLVVVASWGAGQLVEIVAKSALEEFWAMLEAWFKEAFADWNIDGELGALLSVAKKDLDHALKDRMQALESERAQLKAAGRLSAQVDSELRQASSPTLGIALSSGLNLAMHTWSVLDQAQSVKGGPPPPSSGTIMVYDIQISGAEAQNTTGKGWAIRYGLSKKYAAGSLLTSRQVTPDEDYGAPGNNPRKYIGVVREYKVDEKWLQQNEGKRYEGLDRPKYRTSSDP